MIVPQYWAEARRQSRSGGRQVTVRRFGWSDASQDDAQANADARAEEALKRAVAGETIARRDVKVPYGGAFGLPIREEILARHGETVITRNGYGARCLNTPDVLFVDVDFVEKPATRAMLAVFAVLLVAAIAGGVAVQSWRIALGLVVLALALGYPVASRLNTAMRRFKGGVAEAARARVAAFIAGHPDWHLRIYETPTGLRLLAMHRTFRPDEPAVAECFRALGADPIYVRMCLNQKCFRARLSAKPWRIGVDRHIRPSPGVWPVRPERLPERNRWIEAYETAALGYAACRFLEAVGSETVDPAAQVVQVLHDELCQALEPLPMG